MSGQPLVAAIMITGKDPARVPMAKVAIEAFRAQTYENKILVIVNDGEKLPLPTDISADQLMVRDIPTLGQLRNTGLVAAEGQRADFAIQWDDDDFCHPGRIMYQMAAASAGYCVLLKHQIRFSMIENNAFNFKWRYESCPGIPGTILHPLRTDLAYPAESKGEDEVFIQQHFPGRCVVLDNEATPQMYTRLVHDSNTWDPHHIMQTMPGYGTFRNTWLLTRDQARYLSRSLNHYDLGDKVLDATIREPAAA